MSNTENLQGKVSVFSNTYISAGEGGIETPIGEWEVRDG
jgi:hypothetical protein